MAETLGPMSELTAVNEMLFSIGEADITTLTGSIAPDATIALNLLRGASRDLQEEGWQFNTEDNATITPDGDGYLQIPDDVLRIDGLDSTNVAWRSGKLWNTDDNTFVFTGSMSVTLVRHLAWDDLPQVVRRMVRAIATNKFHSIYPPTPEGARLAANEYAEARIAFSRAENENADYNILTNSLTISTILRRGS